MRNIPFLKMNGAGNDFVVLDARKTPLSLTKEQVVALCSRESQVTRGCDQLIILEPPAGQRAGARHPRAFMRIYNADGGEVSACGNATRCVGWLLMRESGAHAAQVQTAAGLLDCETVREGAAAHVTVDMGKARFSHADIPLAEGVKGNNIDIEGLIDGMAVGMGNPHVVFFVEDAAGVDLARIGPAIEHRTDLFPERVNVSVAEIRPDGGISLRVWERGAGLTLACGTAACATLAAAVKRGLAKEKSAHIHLPGGLLRVEQRTDGHLWLTGPVEEEFRGEVEI